MFKIVWHLEYQIHSIIESHLLTAVVSQTHGMLFHLFRFQKQESSCYWGQWSLGVSPYLIPIWRKCFILSQDRIKMYYHSVNCENYMDCCIKHAGVLGFFLFSATLQSVECHAVWCRCSLSLSLFGFVLAEFLVIKGSILKYAVLCLFTAAVFPFG